MKSINVWVFMKMIIQTTKPTYNIFHFWKYYVTWRFFFWFAGGYRSLSGFTGHSGKTRNPNLDYNFSRLRRNISFILHYYNFMEGKKILPTVVDKKINDNFFVSVRVFQSKSSRRSTFVQSRIQTQRRIRYITFVDARRLKNFLMKWKFAPQNLFTERKMFVCFLKILLSLSLWMNFFKYSGRVVERFYFCNFFRRSSEIFFFSFHRSSGGFLYHLIFLVPYFWSSSSRQRANFTNSLALVVAAAPLRTVYVFFFHAWASSHLSPIS